MNKYLYILFLFVLITACSKDFEINTSNSEFTKSIPLPNDYWSWMDYSDDSNISSTANGGLIFGTPYEMFEVNEDGSLLRPITIGPVDFYEKWINNYSSEDNNLFYYEDDLTDTYLKVTDKNYRTTKSFNNTPLGYPSYGWFGMDINQDASVYSLYRFHRNVANESFLNIEYYENQSLSWSRNIPYDTLRNGAQYIGNDKLFIDSNNELIILRKMYDSENNVDYLFLRIDKTGKTTSVVERFSDYYIQEIQKFKDRIIVLAEPRNPGYCQLTMFFLDLDLNFIHSEMFPHCNFVLRYAGDNEIFFENYYFEDADNTRSIYQFDMDGNQINKYQFDNGDFSLRGIRKNDDGTYYVIVGLGEFYEYDFFILKRPANRIFDVF